MIHMKCQDLFSLEKKIECHLLQILPHSLRVRVNMVYPLMHYCMYHLLLETLENLDHLRTCLLIRHFPVIVVLSSFQTPDDTNTSIKVLALSFLHLSSHVLI